MDWVDRAILAAWFRLNESLCSKCGRPQSVHKDDKPGDYKAAWLTCTATVALNRARHKHSDLPAEKASRKNGPDPEHARQWFTYTAAEGLPSFD